jgi:hypothetical protein
MGLGLIPHDWVMFASYEEKNQRIGKDAGVLERIRCEEK